MFITFIYSVWVIGMVFFAMLFVTLYGFGFFLHLVEGKNHHRKGVK